LSKFGDALGGRDQVQLRDTLRGRDQASLEMHLQAMIEQDRSSTLRRSIGGASGAETLAISYSTRNRGKMMR
jgi:hypothetical protein